MQTSIETNHAEVKLSLKFWVVTGWFHAKAQQPENFQAFSFHSAYKS